MGTCPVECVGSWGLRTAVERVAGKVDSYDVPLKGGVQLRGM